jgi:hypothetical protein
METPDTECNCEKYIEGVVTTEYCSIHRGVINKSIPDIEGIAQELDDLALSRRTSINGVLVQMWDSKVLTAYVEGKLNARDTYWKERVRDVKFDIEALRGSPRDTDIEYARAITDVHKILDDIIDNLK